jgi:hypothetical protein
MDSNYFANPVVIVIMIMNAAMLVDIVRRATRNQAMWVILWIFFGPFAYIAFLISKKSRTPSVV